MNKLDKRVVVITGGTSGIGLAHVCSKRKGPKSYSLHGARMV